MNLFRLCLLGAVLLCPMFAAVVVAQCSGPFCRIRERRMERVAYRMDARAARYESNGYGSTGGYSNEAAGSHGGYGGSRLFNRASHGSAGGYSSGQGSHGGYSQPATVEPTQAPPTSQQQPLPNWQQTKAAPKPQAVVASAKVSKCGNLLCTCKNCTCGPNCKCGLKEEKLAKLPEWKTPTKIASLPIWDQPPLLALR